MKNAPVVYVPTTPEGDGLTLPTVLSVLAHAIVIGILIYHYYHLPEPEGMIETTMVTPEELAEIQGQILANRAAASMASGEDNLPSGAISDAPSNPNPANPQTVTSQRVPVFTQSNDAADSDYEAPILMSQEQNERLLEQSQSYEESLSEWSAQQEGVALNKIEQVEQSRREEFKEERERLKEYRQRQNNPPKIERPNSSQRNIEISAGGSGAAGKSYNLSDGQSTFAGDSSTSSPNTGRSKSAGGSRGASNSEIINLIRRNYNPPTAAKGSTQRATLSITVNASGDVVNVSASGSDSAVNEAARQAVLSTRNLPIDTDDPKYPTFTIQFNGSN